MITMIFSDSSEQLEVIYICYMVEKGNSGDAEYVNGSCSRGQSNKKGKINGNKNKLCNGKSLF